MRDATRLDTLGSSSADTHDPGTPLPQAVADLPEAAPPPDAPYDPDEAVTLAEEPTLYEEDEPGPHFIEVRIGEDEPETEGLPARETTRP